ncbi:uncharacterized protein LOC130452839 [Diorhabda sublineata]|uniref:uncharacterized protein LOC130452839 n=1 Tax=Diorhabda sublineata TaxID=1163346 RepID=UPI0024E0E039|nr:uncharacterized protein LOC130452839 [Diorhabda sublineata]
MSAQKYGVEFLKSYPGILKITEQVLNIAVLIGVSVCGFQTTIILLGINVFYAICTTTFFLIVRYRSVFKNSTFPWDWIECANCIAVAIMYALGSSIALSEMSKEFIVTAIIGYIAAMVYALETVDAFKLAATPRARYVWTTPNMPE